MAEQPSHRPVLVVGAIGYVGGRLALLLAARGCRVRAMAQATGEKIIGGPKRFTPSRESSCAIPL